MPSHADYRNTRLYPGRIYTIDAIEEGWFCFNHHMMATYGLVPVADHEGHLIYGPVEADTAMGGAPI